jgi:hypothetical protein
VGAVSGSPGDGAGRRGSGSQGTAHWWVRSIRPLRCSAGEATPRAACRGVMMPSCEWHQHCSLGRSLASFVVVRWGRVSEGWQFFFSPRERVRHGLGEQRPLFRASDVLNAHLRTPGRRRLLFWAPRRRPLTATAQGQFGNPPGRVWLANRSSSLVYDQRNEKGMNAHE